MIKTVSDFLTKLVDRERAVLDSYELTHGPTIGKMYEGLSSNVLERIFPPALGLDVVEGFICDDAGNLSGQIDCMLVKGEGERVPYTESYKWNVDQVIAVVEVKKTLHKAEIKDAFDLLRGVLDRRSENIRNRVSSETFDILPAQHAFADITGILPPSYADLSQISFPMQMIFHTLVNEQLSPIRIVWGHHGFKSEYALRQSFMEFIKENIGVHGYGTGRFPHLIVSGDYSLVAATGFPFRVPMKDDFWDFFLSSPDNQIELMLEFIWTRLQREYHLTGLWGEDLDTQIMHPFLATRAVNRNAKIGWEFKERKISSNQLQEEYQRQEWEPSHLDENQFAVVNILCNKGPLSKTDPEFQDILTKNNLDAEEFIKSLVQTGLVAVRGAEVALITEKCLCVIMPGGQRLAGENNTGRMQRWMEKHLRP